ncbi:hypothetical protein NPIL_546371 [Nephila pilipes]|uniref:Uncharacterized protein n=1 Tax=Nephila pilipes TaxID=299642 RepID=A0A8X6UC92_NEPPI|nr:hypothetical protein NPIL_546371 [Nephila pilipes]
MVNPSTCSVTLALSAAPMHRNGHSMTRKLSVSSRPLGCLGRREFVLAYAPANGVAAYHVSGSNEEAIKLMYLVIISK